MEKFTRQNLMIIRSEFGEAIAEFEAKHGISMKLGNISFNNSTFSTKLECAIINGDAGSVDEANFKKEARFFGLEADDFGKKFISNGKTYEITGIKRSRHKYPISAKLLGTNRGYKFTRSTVVNNLIK